MSQTTFPAKPSPASGASSGSTKVDQYIDRQINKTGSHVVAMDVLAGIMILIGGLLAALLALAVIDSWIFELSVAARVIALLVVVGGCAGFSIWYFWPLIFRRINPAYSARMIEEGRGGLRNSLINYLSLKENQHTSASRVVINEIGNKAAADLSEVPVETTVDRSKIIRLGIILTTIVAIFGLYKAISPKDPFQSVARVFAPVAKISRPARVSIEAVEPGDAEVFFGDTLDVKASIAGQYSGPVELVFSTRDGQSLKRRIPMLPDTNGSFLAELQTSESGILQDLVYHIEAGDGRSPTYRVTVQSIPTITVREIRLDTPAYTQLLTSTLNGKGEIDAYEGTRATILAEANVDIQSANIELFNERNVDSAGKMNTIERIILQTDGRTASGSFILEFNAEQTQKMTHYQVKFRDEQGRLAEGSTLYPVRIIPDLPPQIVITQPSEDIVRVPANGQLNVLMRANDQDFQVAQIRFQLSHRGQPTVDQPLKLSQQPDGHVTASYTLVPKLLGMVEGDQAVFLATAFDNKISVISGQPAANFDSSRTITLEVAAAQAQDSTQDSAETQNEQNSSKDEDRNADSKSDSSNDSNTDNNQENPGDSQSNQPSDDRDSESGGDSNADSKDGKQGKGNDSQNGTGNKQKNGSNSESKNGESDDSKSDEAKRQSSSSDQNADGDSSSQDGAEGTESNESSDGNSSKDGKDGGQPSDTGGSPSSQKNQNGNSKPDSNNSGKPDQGDTDGEVSNDDGGGDNAQPLKPDAHDADRFERLLEKINQRNKENNSGDKSQSNEDQQSSEQPSQGNEGSGNQQPESGESQQSKSSSQPTGEQKSGDQKSGDQKSSDQKSGDNPSGNQGSEQKQGDQANSGENSSDSGSQKSNGSDSDNQASPQDSENGSASQTGDKQQENENKQPSPEQNSSSAGNGKQDDDGSDSGNAESGNSGSMGKENQDNQEGNAQGSDSTGGAESKSEEEDKSGGGSSGDPNSPEKKQQTGGGDKKSESGSPKNEQQSKKGGGNSKSENDSKGSGKNDDSSNSGGKADSSSSNSGKESNNSDSKQSNSGSPSSSENGGKNGTNQQDSKSPSSEQANQEQNTGQPRNGTPQDGQRQDGQPQDGKNNGQQGTGKDQQSNGNSKGGDKNAGDRKSADKNDGKGNDSQESGSGEGSQANETGENKPSDSSSGAGNSTGGPGAGSSGDESEQPDRNLIQGQPSAADKANLEYTDKATDLALEYLEDQVIEPDPKLLEELNWTEDDMREFVKRWKEMKERAKSGSARDQQELKDALQSLGLRPKKTTRNDSTGLQDSQRGFDEDGAINRPPAEDIPDFKAFQKGRSRIKK